MGLTINANEFTVPKVVKSSAKELKSDILECIGDCLKLETELARSVNQYSGVLIELRNDLQIDLEAGLSGDDVAINSSSKSERAHYLKNVQLVQAELEQQIKAVTANTKKLQALEQQIKVDPKNLKQTNLKGT